MTVCQNGSSSPSLDRSSFSKSTFRFADYGGGVASWHRLYEDLALYNSPYTFTGQGGGTENTLYRDVLGLFLINYALTNDNRSRADAVARRLEGNFDYATLAAFARQPAAVNLRKTITSTVQVWVYNRTVLAILLVPLLATITALCGRLRSAGEAFLGYDPVGIAALGPVEGMPPRSEPATVDEPHGAKAGGIENQTREVNVREEVDHWIVRGYRDALNQFRFMVSPS